MLNLDDIKIVNLISIFESNHPFTIIIQSVYSKLIIVFIISN